MPACPRSVVRAAIAVIAAAAMLLLTTPIPAHAEVAACGTRAASNYHAGYINPGDPYVEGDYAIIATRYGAVCDSDTTNNNFTNQYAMIASNNLAGWAQDGYMRWYGSSIVFFAQQSSGHTLNTKYGTTALATGSTYFYYNKWDSSCLCMEDIIERTLYLKSTWNPWTSWVAPFSPQFTGEATYRSSDLSGTAAAPASYTAISGQDSATDTWHAYPCGQLQAVNDVAAKRADGKSWHVVATSPCPNFNLYTG
ncbi:MAG: hypothetical protein QOC82_2200 [Frankiaceae bacterium]|jgi:hypothetical protein|nr:hypothetical protein [Frankiaceae bacterium]MDQ1699269.1 hypothetical protein [Frankiaceae bacterium]